MTILMTVSMSMTVMRLKSDGWMALLEHLIQGLDTGLEGFITGMVKISG